MSPNEVESKYVLEMRGGGGGELKSKISNWCHFFDLLSKNPNFNFFVGGGGSELMSNFWLMNFFSIYWLKLKNTNFKFSPLLKIFTTFKNFLTSMWTFFDVECNFVSFSKGNWNQKFLTLIEFSSIFWVKIPNLIFFYQILITFRNFLILIWIFFDVKCNFGISFKNEFKSKISNRW